MISKVQDTYVIFLSRKIIMDIELNQLIEDLSFFRSINTNFQVHIQVPGTIHIHVMAENCISYVIYKLPLKWTPPHPLPTPYYSLNSQKWIDMLKTLNTQNVFLCVEQQNERHFLAAFDWPSYSQTVRVELNEFDNSLMLDIVPINISTESVAIISTFTNTFLKWIDPCTDLAVTYTQLSVPSLSEMELVAYDADGNDQLHILRKNILTQGSCRLEYHLNMSVLVPFLSLTPSPCELRWTIGRPLELEIRHMTVYVAPHEQPSPPQSRAKRKKIDPPHILRMA